MFTKESFNDCTEEDICRIKQKVQELGIQKTVLPPYIHKQRETFPRAYEPWCTEEKEIICLPSVLQVPESLEYLRNMEQNLLLVRSDSGNGKAIESVLYLYKMHDVKIDGVVLMDVDASLISRYRFKLFGNKEDM